MFGKPGTAAAVLVAPVASIAINPTNTTSFRIDTLFLLTVTPASFFRKSQVKREPPAFAGGSFLCCHSSPSRFGRWVSWHLPDLTRQCAFDLRSRPEILAIRPDDVLSPEGLSCPIMRLREPPGMGRSASL
jgi:hypothetical protein